MPFARRSQYSPMQWAAACGATLMAGAALLTALPQRSGTQMIRYEIQLEQTEFTPEEQIRLVVRITNGTPVPVQLPDPGSSSNQPVYSITGPGYPDGVRFSRAGVIPADQPVGQPAAYASAPPPKLLTIEPQGQRGILVPLSSMVDLRRTGDYRLTSELEWKGTRLAAGPVTFRVVPVSISSTALGTGISPIGVAQGEIAYLQRGKDGAYLYRARFLEHSPEVEEASVSEPAPPVRAGKDAADIGVPCSNGPFGAEFIQWVVWRDGRCVVGLSNLGDQVSLELPGAPAKLVRPPLKTTKGPIDVLAVSADQRQLILVRFPASETDPETPPSVVWTAALPAKVHGITAAIASVAEGGTRHVAFTAALATGFEIYHSRYAPNGALEPFISTRVEAGELADDGEPGLFVDEAGRAHVGLVAVSPVRGAENSYRSALVEAVFEPGSKPPERPALTPLDASSPKPLAAAVFYHPTAEEPMRREVVIQFPDRTTRFNGSGMVDVTALPGVPTSPILIVGGKGGVYILSYLAGEGFQLSPL